MSLIRKYGSVLILFIILFSAVIVPAFSSALGSGQQGFFKINGAYVEFNDIQFDSSFFDIPQDKAPEGYLANQELALEMDAAPLQASLVLKRVLHWDFGDGTTATGLKNTHRYTRPGTFVVKITDDSDPPQLIESAVIQILPYKGYRLPKAVISVNGEQKSDLVLPFSQPVSFDATGSTASSRIVSYTWDFNDGTSGSQPVCRHRYDKGTNWPMVFVLLRIRDKDGFFADACAEIINQDENNQGSSLPAAPQNNIPGIASAQPSPPAQPDRQNMIAGTAAWLGALFRNLSGRASALGIRLAGAGFTNFKIVFLSIIIEALPFVIIGVLVSALLENFVSEEAISNFFPRNRYLGILLACFLGIIFPICECGIVPVARRLISKGVPLYSAVAFMLAAPIINPVTASSTAVAFFNNRSLLWWRFGLAFLVAYLTGLIISFAVEGNQLNRAGDGGCHECACSIDHVDESPSLTAKAGSTLLDASNEFFEMGKYLVAGAFLGALAQAFIPRQSLLGVGHHPLWSVLVMVAFAFGVSVCSSADAFIAASLATSFSGGALLAFMVFGPMVDVKNTLMLLNAFKPRFVLLLIPVIMMLVIAGAFLINIL